MPSTRVRLGRASYSSDLERPTAGVVVSWISNGVYRIRRENDTYVLMDQCMEEMQSRVIYVFTLWKGAYWLDGLALNGLLP